MKKSIFLILSFLVAVMGRSQEASSTFLVLKLPTSAHAAALGGDNVSLIEDSPWSGWANPALYSSVSDGSFGLDFMTYAAGGSWMGAQYVKAFGERHTAAFHAQYMSYGSVDETDASGTVLGSFTPKDIVVGGAYSYLLSDLWAGGAAVKVVSSTLADYSAWALSLDLGLNYYDADRDFSLSAALRNVGAQLRGYNGRTERLPFNMQMGFTKGMSHAPVRFSVTMTDMTRWATSDYYHKEGSKPSFGRKLINHFVVGVDVLPTPTTYISLGYNFRRAYELKAADGAHGAGLSFGAGLQLSRFRLGASYAKYHVSTSSLLFNVGYVF